MSWFYSFFRVSNVPVKKRDQTFQTLYVYFDNRAFFHMTSRPPWRPHSCFQTLNEISSLWGVSYFPMQNIPIGYTNIYGRR